MLYLCIMNKHINKSKRDIKPLPKRSFGGVIEDKTNRLEVNFEAKHLKEYLRGSVFFEYGYYTNEQGFRRKLTHKVKEQWT